MPKRRMKRHAVTQPQDPSYRLIPLTQGQNAIVDTADYEWLNQWNWYAQWDQKTKTFYAMRWITRPKRRKLLPMHSAILKCKPGEQGDHINRDTLDNRKYNLRKATSAQNCHNRGKRISNSSGFTGVSWDTQRDKWRADIEINGRHKPLGRFYSREDAARAYDRAVLLYHGEFAHLNFPKEKP